MADLYSFDAYATKEIAERVETIGLGALYFVIVKSDASLGFAAAQLLGGLAFSLGLFLVVVAGAEFFTGNNLLAMAWADGSRSFGACCAMCW
jgi:formate/nitrite transporter FocA (FNT family)